MPKECVERMMKGKKKMTREEAHAVCYPKKGNPSKKSSRKPAY